MMLVKASYIDNNFGICCSYDELRLHHKGELPSPSHFGPSQFTVATFDNIDHDESTISGIGGSHDTVSVLFQEDEGTPGKKPRLCQAAISHRKKHLFVS